MVCVSKFLASDGMEHAAERMATRNRSEQGMAAHGFFSSK
jgi:hypothetical protein